MGTLAAAGWAGSVRVETLYGGSERGSWARSLHGKQLGVTGGAR